MNNNIFINGDNIAGLEFLINKRKLAGKIDLVYIDPPFSTNCKFVVSKDRSSTISSPRNGKVAYTDKVLGKDFIEFLRERMLLLRELLSEKGSIYVHSDYKIGHYVKVMMDEVFGIDNFRNDITRVKCSPKNFTRIGYGNIKDMILFYTKGKKPIWNEPRENYTEENINTLFPKCDSNGRRYTTVPIHGPGETLEPKPFRGIYPPPGRHWRTDVSVLEKWDEQGLIEWSSNGNPRKIIFADEKKGKKVQDIWTSFKDPMYPKYPTEKNYEMIKRIVGASSNEGSIVLDCFSGSGTTLQAADEMHRKWIGIDNSQVAYEVTCKRFNIPEGNEGIFNGIERIKLK